MKNNNARVATLLLGVSGVLVFQLLLSSLAAWQLALTLLLLHYGGLVVIGLVIEKIRPTKRSQNSLSFIYHVTSLSSLIFISVVAWILGNIKIPQLLVIISVSILVTLLHYRLWASKSVKGVNPERLFQ